MRRILVVNVNWVGDVVLSTPIFRALKEKYPGAKLSCLAAPRVQAVLESVPELEEIIIYEEEDRHKSPWAKLQLIGALRRRRFDAAFLLHRSLTRALLVFLAGIPERVGYDTKGRGFLLTRRIPQPKPLDDLHRQDYYLNVVESFGIKVRDRDCALQVSHEAANDAERKLEARGGSPGQPYVVVHPCANWDLKRWPVFNWVRCIERMTAEGIPQIVLVGSGKDADLGKDIGAALSSQAQKRIINLIGQTNLKQLLAVLKQARLVISADSGPLHLASAVGTPVVGLFGPTRPEVTGPRGRAPAEILQRDVGCNRRPCYHLGCPDNTCMQAVTVEDVLGAAKSRLFVNCS